MRRMEFAMTLAQAVECVRAAPVMQVCGVLESGEPVLKSLHGVVVDEWLCFHSSPKGEKTSLLGRPVVASVEETVARIPSYFTDPVQACPATTLFRSVQVHGVLERLDEPSLKARALQALMEKLQPEGGHTPITNDDPMYRPEVKGLLIGAVRLERVDGKAKLAQNKRPHERAKVLEGLWKRGEPGDLRAIELIRRANPGDAPPEFLQTSAHGVTLHAWVEPSRAGEVAALLAHEYWNEGQWSVDTLTKAHLGSTAWVAAMRDGRVVASARAIADGAKYAWVYDVVVDRAARGQGLGKAVTKLLLDHPAVRDAGRVLLATRDAQGLYSQFGFVDRAQSVAALRTGSTEMVRLR